MSEQEESVLAEAAANTVDSNRPVSEEAPLGYNKDGSIRQRRGRKPGQRSGTGVRRRTTAAKTDYATPLTELFSLPAGALALAAVQLKSKPLAADSAAVSMHAPHIAQALDQVAQEQPQIAAVLDKVLQGGPYVVLFATALPLVLQLTTNHGLTPPGIMGSRHPDDLIAQFAPTITMGASPNGDQTATANSGDTDHPA